jgi:2-polyprenyl-6-methoxyphenol hydroxylase-like FAD-dependent oxidoreductase
MNKEHATGLRVAIVGASLGGLSAANVLHRLGAQVEVFEYFPHGFHDRGGALGAVDTDLLHQICGNTRPRSRPPIRRHGHFYGDLWQYLMDGLPEDMVRFGIGVEEIIDSTPATPRLEIAGEGRGFDLVIGADGGKSTIRRYVTNAVPEYSGYNLWRGLVPVEGIPGPPSGTRTLDGVRYETLGFPFVNGRGIAMWNCGVYMMTPKSEVAAPTRNRQVTSSETGGVPDWFIPVVRALFGDRNAEFWQACAVNGKVSAHPVWEFAADTVVNRRIMLLGDAAHMASPRTGAGAYTAMVDAVTLGTALEQCNTIEEALQFYNDDTVERGRLLWKRSRRAAAYFAPESSPPVSPAGLPIRVSERLPSKTY